MCGKFGIYVPDELMRELEDCMKSLGIKNKSLVLREALRLFISEHKWRAGDSILGVISVIYDHEVRGVDSELTDIQHDYLNEIISALHIHIDHRNCMLVLALKGNSERVKSLLARIIKLKGVKLVRPVLMSVESEKPESSR
ncbi:MAG: nickel-responsive transcriptional regulator NikR [Desulfurococcaceae archaeon TW002]